MAAEQGDYLKITAPHLSVGSERLKEGDVIPVELVSVGVAEQLVAGKLAEWRKTPGDAPAKKGTD